MKRIVLDISRMTNHNGPGFRTLVLFKGCPLRCAWCSTPESQNMTAEIGVFDGKCTGCGVCLPVCSDGAICMENGKVRIDRSKCSYCGKCEKECYHDAIKYYGHQMEPQEVLEEILKDRILMETSGGGVTFSGGEPLIMGGDYNRVLFSSCKEEGINVGVQTCGHVPWANIENVIDYVDFFLWDIKHMDAEKHKEITGVSNELLLENLKKVSDRGVPVYIRVPVIPGFNDSEDNLLAIVDFVKTLESVEAFDILPIHHLGKTRYEGLSRPYPIGDVPLASQERMQELKHFIEDQGIPCGIGG